MDKEKEIEEIAKILKGYVTDKDEARNTLAYLLVANGYGNIEQAVREFAEEVKQFVVCCKLTNKQLAKEKDLAQLINDILQQVENHIDDFVKKKFIN